MIEQPEKFTLNRQLQKISHANRTSKSHTKRQFSNVSTTINSKQKRFRIGQKRDNFCYLIFVYIYIYPPDSRESDGDANT